MFRSREDNGPANGNHFSKPFGTLTRKEAIYRYKRLSQETAVVSGFEKIHKDILLNEGPYVLYEPLKLPVSYGPTGNEMDAYTPDFLLPYNFINGRAMVIEPHPADLFVKHSLHGKIERSQEGIRPAHFSLGKDRRQGQEPPGVGHNNEV